MRWRKCFLPTLRESPAGAETVGEKLLVRAGFVRAVSSGVYGYLPLGMRSLGRVQAIAHAALQAIGGQEVWLDAAAAAEIARGELRSARQLPQVWYRIATDIFRPRQFGGLDVYWFGAERAVIEAALRSILERCGIGANSFVVLRSAGPDAAAACDACGYIESLATAASVPVPPPPDVEGDLQPEPFHTPGQKTIADLARFTGQPESMQMKSLILVANGKPVLVILRGDHQLSEAKFAAKSGDARFRQATADELVKWFGASPGSLGPVGVTTMPVWMDTALEGRRNMVCGANRDDYHLRHVTPGKDFQAELADLRETAVGDSCPRCGAGLKVAR
jgi:prolyl-tRNA synthetase